MPISLSWDETLPNTTRIVFSGVVTMNELFDVWKQESDMQRQHGDVPVYSLNVFDNVQPSIGGISMRKLREFVTSNKPHNLQMTVQVASSHMLRRSLQTIANTMPHEVHIVATEQEAEALG